MGGGEKEKEDEEDEDELGDWERGGGGRDADGNRVGSVKSAGERARIKRTDDEGDEEGRWIIEKRAIWAKRPVAGSLSPLLSFQLGGRTSPKIRTETARE